MNENDQNDRDKRYKTIKNFQKTRTKDIKQLFVLCNSHVFENNLCYISKNIYLKTNVNHILIIIVTCNFLKDQTDKHEMELFSRENKAGVNLNKIFIMI